ncbi:MAG: hypothetical protein KF715_21735 [Candidatus Didemnitutus sp.]|nr:hypothetical protein [Candidatus Didemnitutus sp.]
MLNWLRALALHVSIAVQLRLAAFLALALTSLSAASSEAQLGERLFHDARFARSPAAMSCATCHPSITGEGQLGAFADRAGQSAVPDRADGQRVTPRHASTLLDVAEPGGWGLLHWDGEFASLEELIKGTFTGRNFGWLADERAAAVAHFARIVREDVGAEGRAAYAIELRETEPAMVLATTGDGLILDVCARAVAAYLRTIRLPRDAEGRHSGSPYDAFLSANRLPRAPNPGETPHEYARRLHATVAALRQPIFVDDPARRLTAGSQSFRFGEEELRGMRIFFRGAMGYVRSASAGNCAECHVPPQFTDFAFHNTGATQDRYDAVHGAGAFANLEVPSLAERNADPERWLPPAATHPRAADPWRSVPDRAQPAHADLGLWNVYANSAMPAPQVVIERQLNRAGTLAREAVLSATLARFKTPSVRNLGREAPLLHDGSAKTVEDVLRIYRRMSDLARQGAMRNAPAEFAAMRLAEADLPPLAAFLHSLQNHTATAR